MKVVYADISGKSPAKTDRQKEIIYLNNNIFPFLPEHEQLFIIEHESGHIELNTSNEFLADAFASSEILGKYTNSEIITFNSLLNNLDLTNPEHKKRIIAQLKRISKFKKSKNKMDLNNAHYTEDEFIDMLMEDFDIPDELYDSFIGGRHLTKKQAKKDLKKRLKEKYGSGFFKPGKYFKYRKEFKSIKSQVVKDALSDYQKEKWKAKEEKKDIKAEGTKAREEKYNIGSDNAAPVNTYAADKPERDNKNMLMYGLIGLAVLVIGFIAYKKFF